MKEDRFPHDIQLTALHMSMTLLLSLILSLGTARFSSFIWLNCKNDLTYHDNSGEWVRVYLQQKLLLHKSVWWILTLSSTTCGLGQCEIWLEEDKRHPWLKQVLLIRLAFADNLPTGYFPINPSVHTSVRPSMLYAWFVSKPSILYKCQENLYYTVSRPETILFWPCLATSGFSWKPRVSSKPCLLKDFGRWRHKYIYVCSYACIWSSTVYIFMHVAERNV